MELPGYNITRERYEPWARLCVHTVQLLFYTNIFRVKEPRSAKEGEKFVFSGFERTGFHAVHCDHMSTVCNEI